MITVVLDDDPTGTQAMSDVSVVLDWSDARRLGRACATGDRAVHVLTNSARTRPPRRARADRIGRRRGARRGSPSARLVLRGDSTLRAHVWEEYDALRAVIAPARAGVPLLLVPALPAAGRVTIGGVHLLERDGERVPLDRTEYARDGALAYSDARARAAGRTSAAAAGSSAADAVDDPARRACGGRRAPTTVAAAIAAAARHAGVRPSVIPDAETRRRPARRSPAACARPRTPAAR